MGLGRVVFELLIAALVVWRVSTTIAIAKIFEPLRNALDPGPRRSAIRSRTTGVRAWFHELVCCQFCISHYIALIYLQFWYIDLVRTNSPVVNFVITWMAVVGLSSIIARAYQRPPAQNAERPANSASDRVPEPPPRTGVPRRRPDYDSSYLDEFRRSSPLRKRAS